MEDSKSSYKGLSYIENNWFKEVNHGWACYSSNIEIEQILFAGKSHYQDVLVFESKAFGNVLILNGIIQCTEKDEFTYQEMITHLPMALHANPLKVLVIGGGDGGVIREILKYDCVKEVVLCELDQLVVDVCRKYLPTMTCSLDDPRVTVNIGDGVEFIKDHPGEFDVIITDSPDPEGGAEALFENKYYSYLKNALREGGIACSQGLTPFTDLPFIKNWVSHCKEIFHKVGYATGTIPSFSSGLQGFLLLSNIPDIDFTKPSRRFSEEDLSRMCLKYYNSDVHSASFALPNFVRTELKDVIDT